MVECALIRKAEKILGRAPSKIPEAKSFPFDKRCDLEARRWSSRGENLFCLPECARGSMTDCVGWGACSRRVYSPAHTKVIHHEELLMLTGGKYPDRLRPVTSAEEMTGITVDANNGARILIGRGFEPAENGHKALLIADGILWIDTNAEERSSMMEAAESCPQGARVFVGGLGLGLVLLYAAKRRPREIVVCEISPAISSLVWPKAEAWFRQKYPSTTLRPVNGDAVEEVQKNAGYDWVSMDLCQQPAATPKQPACSQAQSRQPPRTSTQGGESPAG